MMELYLDNIVFTIQKAGGVSVYWYELVKGIHESGLDVHFLNTRSSSPNIFEQKINYSNFRCIRESSIPARCLRYLPLQRKLPEAAVFHSGYLRVSPQQNVVNILTVHDFAHERKLATPFPRGLANTTQKAYGLKKADGIICISESTRKELQHFYPETVDKKIKVIYHGIADDFYPTDKSQPPVCTLPLDLQQRYILYVGARNKYKNFKVAIATMQQLPEHYRLVVVGGEPWGTQETEQLETLIPGRYELLPVVSSAELNILYNHAFCMLYPSVYEGFGFPPGEAMKAGCVVVSSNFTAIPEVVGQAGVLVDRAEPAAFAGGIRKLENAQYKQQMIDKGLKQAEMFTWQKTVRETLAFYQDCWNHKFLK